MTPGREHRFQVAREWPRPPRVCADSMSPAGLTASATGPAIRDRSVAGGDATSEATASAPFGHDLQPSGGHHCGEIISNLIGHSLIEDAFVAERLAVQLEALELDTCRTGLESERDRSEVRMPRLGADRCELLVDVLDEKGGVGRCREYFKKRCVWHGGDDTEEADRTKSSRCPHGPTMASMRETLLVLAVLGLQSCFVFKNGEQEAQRALLEARGEQAESALTAGDYLEAARLFLEILSVEPENVPAWIGMGDAYGEIGEWDHAEPAFAEATRLEPESYDAQFGHGLALQMLNRLIEAVAAYHRALTIDPMSSNASLGVATSYLQLEEPQHALPFAERAVELNPDDGRAWISLGAAAEQVGDNERALDAYLAASERLEASPELKYNLLHAYARAKRYQEVVGIARSMLADQANAEAAERMGWAYFRLGHYEKSAEAYRRAVEIEPPMWRAWNGLGVTALNRWLLSEQADEESRIEASTAFSTSLRLQPDQPKVAQLVERYRL